MKRKSITRREFAKKSLQSTLALSALPLLSDCGSTRRQPNIIIIMADDLGYGDIGCYGNTTIKTPNIDALARHGIRFTDYHANGSVCTPTRAALLTGRYQQRSGLEGVIYALGETRQTGLATSEVTFAKALQSAGYTTAVMGKWHLGYKPEFNPLHHGFDVFRGYVSGNVDYVSHIDGAGYHDWWHDRQKVPEEGYTTDLISSHAVKFIEKNRDKPFCLYVAHEAPHFPFQGRNDPAIRTAGARNLANTMDEAAKSAYKEMIEALDDSVGEIVSTVRNLGLGKETFIFFCSDNGAYREIGSNGVLRGSKVGLFEGGHRVPAIAYWQGNLNPGTKTDATVMSMDLFPTMLSIAGVGIPSNLQIDGVNLLPLLTNEASLPERSLFWRYQGQKVVRKGKWKLLIDNDKVSLYDLSNDLAETKNLAEEHVEITTQLQRELLNWEREVLQGVALRTK